jgi:hypothetical protein
MNTDNLHIGLDSLTYESPDCRLIYTLNHPESILMDIARFPDSHTDEEMQDVIDNIRFIADRTWTKVWIEGEFEEISAEDLKGTGFIDGRRFDLASNPCKTLCEMSERRFCLVDNEMYDAVNYCNPDFKKLADLLGVTDDQSRPLCIHASYSGEGIPDMVFILDTQPAD